MAWSWELLLVGALAAMVLCAGIIYLIRRRLSRPGLERKSITPAPLGPRGLTDGLTRTRQSLLYHLREAWSAGRDTEARLLALEEALLAGDVGPKATQQLLAELRPLANRLEDAEALRRALADRIRVTLSSDGGQESRAKPHVILVVGVNGVGKTTTIGKLAWQYSQRGQTVLLVAADTFRAAAAEQLEIWAQRLQVACVRHQSGADPSAVAFDGIKAALAREVDVVIVDTAGRLHVKAHLMEELKKVARVIARQLDGAPHEILLVIDATTGQNAINQVRVFCEALPVSGIVLTKLDGTAKGGAILGLRAELEVPIRYVGIGEGVADLMPFDAGAFVEALLSHG